MIVNAIIYLSSSFNVQKQSAAPAPAAAAASQPPPSEPKKAPVKSNTLTRAGKF